MLPLVALGPVGSFIFLTVLAIALFVLGKVLGGVPVPVVNTLLKWACTIGAVLCGLLAIYIGLTEGITALLGWVTNHTGTTIVIIFVAVCIVGALTHTSVGFGSFGKMFSHSEEEKKMWRDNMYRDKYGNTHTNGVDRDIANKRYDETH